LVRERYFDGLAVIRAQDNRVVQWRDPDEKNPRPMTAAASRPRFTRRL
jgi:cyclophilin family peptidyl-prolyl cis-trans isomerase